MSKPEQSPNPDSLSVWKLIAGWGLATGSFSGFLPSTFGWTRPDFSSMNLSMNQTRSLRGWVWPRRTSQTPWQRLSHPKVKALDESLGNPWVEGVFFSHGLKNSMYDKVPYQLPSINYRNEYWFSTLALSCSLLGAEWDWEELGEVLLGVGWRAALQRHLL